MPWNISGNKVIVYLSPDEIKIANDAGMKMFMSAEENSRNANTRNFRTPAEIITHHKRAQISEMAVAKAIGVPYAFDNRKFKKEPDVGRFDVRAVDNPRYRLYCVDSDHDKRPFIKVIVEGYRCILSGWQYGYEVKQEKNKRMNENGSFYWLGDPNDDRTMISLKEFGGSI